MLIKLNNNATSNPKIIPNHADWLGRYSCPTAKLTKKGDHKTAVFIPLIAASPDDCLILYFAFLGITEDKRGNVPMFITPPRTWDVTWIPDKILVETKLERRFCVFATEGIVIAVDLSNHKLGRKAEKMIKKLPAFQKLSSLGRSFKIKYVAENKTHMIIFN